jgi:hypothetical protein
LVAHTQRARRRATYEDLLAVPLEVDYFDRRDAATDEQVRFWLRELRTPELLVELARRAPDQAHRASAARPAVAAAMSGDLASIERALSEEQAAERERDRVYWRPLRTELEQLSRTRRG